LAFERHRDEQDCDEERQEEGKGNKYYGSAVAGWGVQDCGRSGLLIAWYPASVIGLG